MVSETFPLTTKFAAFPTSGGGFPYACNNANYDALPKTANSPILARTLLNITS